MNPDETHIPEMAKAATALSAAVPFTFSSQSAGQALLLDDASSDRNPGVLSERQNKILIDNSNSRGVPRPVA